MLTFQKIIDFARNHKETILDQIEDTISTINNHDFKISVNVIINDITKGFTPLKLAIDEKHDNICDYPSISLFSVFVNDETRTYNREKLHNIINDKLDNFERLINAIKNTTKGNTYVT